MARTPKTQKETASTKSFEASLFEAADKMRGTMDASEYKHVVLGLIFLKFISESFEAKHAELIAEGEDAEEKDFYEAENIYWVPEEARWSRLQAQARQATIGTLIDSAMKAIENSNETLRGVLPKDYGRPTLNKQMVGELIDLIGTITVTKEGDNDVLGRVYEYFLGSFAKSEGKGGEFYTPRSIVKLLVEILEPYKGRVYDPCCGSGGMFVQSEEFVEAHGGRRDNLSIYGQESNPTTWRMAKMNMAIRRIEADIRWNNEGSFHRDAHQTLKADFVLANPPFNVSDWGGDKLKDDVRWKFGVPPAGNANYAWLQHIIHHLAPTGKAGVVLANGSMSSNQSGEGEIRQRLIEADVVDCMIAMPGQLFYSTQIPVCLWFLTRTKKIPQHDRSGHVLFIDARKMGQMVDRTRRELTADDIALIAGTYHKWAKGEPYADIAGFCKLASLEEIKKEGYVLTPGRYVGTEEEQIDDEPFIQKFPRLLEEIDQHFAEGERLNALIRSNLKALLHANS